MSDSNLKLSIYIIIIGKIIFNRSAKLSPASKNLKGVSILWTLTMLCHYITAHLNFLYEIIIQIIVLPPLQQTFCQKISPGSFCTYLRSSFLPPLYLMYLHQDNQNSSHIRRSSLHRAQDLHANVKASITMEVTAHACALIECFFLLL